MFSLPPLRSALAAATLIMVAGIVPAAAVAGDVWYMEGFMAAGSATSARSLTRIHGTVQFTANQIQFSTNSGSFTREASLAGMEYNRNRKEAHTYTDFNFDPPVEVTEYLVVENTKAKLTPIDADTLILNFGNTKYPLYDSEGNFSHLLKSYEWIGAILTKRAVSSRLFPFDSDSVELWLQPDLYDGSATVFGTNHETFSIDSNGYSGQATFGGSPSDGFFVDWDNDTTQIYPNSNLNELIHNWSDSSRTFVNSKYYYLDDNTTIWGISENYITEAWENSHFLHLGDGRVFWFIEETYLGETTFTNFETGDMWSSGTYMFNSEMECGVAEQKLWFEASFSPQAAGVQSKALGTTTKETIPNSLPKAAIVKEMRGEVFEVNGTVERQLNVGDKVSIGSTVRTATKSFVKIIFLDRSQMNIGPDSEMKVEKGTPKEPSVINFIRGVIREQVTKDYLQIQKEKSKLNIKTVNCALGVRGTEFEISYSEDQGIGTTQLQMIEGAVEFTDLNTGVTTLTTDQDLIVAQGSVNSSGFPGSEITVLDPTFQSLTSGISSQALGVVAPLDSSEPLVLRIRNIGMTALSGVNPVIQGENAADFQIIQSPEETLSPLVGEGIIEIIFTPSALGTRQAVLAISSSDGDESPFLINLEGIGANSSATGFAAWSGSASFSADTNGDGVRNGMAFLLGATDPNAHAHALLPTVTQSNGNITFTFSMLNAAYRSGASLSLEYSSDLGISDPWAPALVPDVSSIVNGVTFNITPGSRNSQVTATIPATEAISGRLFGRLKAVE